MGQTNNSGARSSERQRLRTAQSPESKAAFSSRKTEIVGLRTMCPCSKSHRKVKIWSIQHWPGREPVCFSRTHAPWVLDNRQRIMPVNVLNAILTKLILLWFSQEYLSPFLSFNTNADSYQCSGICFPQTDPRRFVNSDFNASHCHSPDAFYHLRKSISLITSLFDRRLGPTCIDLLAWTNGRPTAAL